jgi:DNA (cytosine-5)-methyltransferase 1
MTLIEEQTGIVKTSKNRDTGSFALPPAVIDFCSGLGGLSSAASDLGMRILAGVDTNAAAAKTFGRNFPEAAFFEGSVRSTKILQSCRRLIATATESGGSFILVSGPPCQGFSVAGSRNPKDKRNKVLVAVAHAIADLQPECALIENVSMVLADKYEKRVDSFNKALIDGGYYVTRVILNASEFGVAQRRKRAFFLITKQEFTEADVLAKLEKHKTTLKPTKEALAGLPPATVRPDKYNDEENYGEVFNHLAMQHSARVQAKIAAIPWGKGPMSYRKLHPDRPSNTLFSGHRAPPAHFSEPRSITVREAARLQGFPDSFRVFGSFGSQMEQVTNAVPPPLARVVLSVLTALCGIKLTSDD